MKANLIQCFQIICLVVAVAYNADAQIRPGVRPNPPNYAANDILSRENSQVIELGNRGMVVGQNARLDITREVHSRMAQPLLSSLVILASSERGQGQLDLLVNGQLVSRRQEQLPMKRKAIQIDMNHGLRDLRSVEILTNGRVLIHSITVNSSRVSLPSLEDGQGGLPDGRHPVVRDVCDIQASGVVNGRFYRHVITLKGQGVDGADSIDELNGKIRQIEQAGLCRLSQAECSLGASGVVGGEFKKIIIKRGNIGLTGADDLNRLLEISEKIRAGQLCSMAVHRCELTSAGVAGGQFYQHRLLVNGEALFGANDLGGVLNQLNQLRQFNICR